ncbi:MAG TPA: cysteine--tRNA ligase [Thermomicrobiales bacterium]|nr:cysteine--tRNA ligase [Thermomicrobiales bacterium]
MNLYNSATRSVEPLTVIDNHVGIYVCGVTPYDTTHAGHAFTFLTFDILVRFLRSRGYKVTYAQNVTDIDDDILRKSKELGTTWDELGRSETDKYLNDMRQLNALPFDHYLRATETVPLMVSLIETLVEEGHAYVANGSVYFSVSSDPEFGKLSRIPRGEMLAVANERGNNPDDPNKQDPIDFVLWQAAKPGEPTWDSPWGPGRPGWHIECSAMSMSVLGNTVDIHGGGADLIFPHHECEIAQSENATGVRPFTRYWMHVAMVEYQGEKMSKSLGNLVIASNVLADYPADAFRLYLFSHHYRTPWEYIDEEIDGFAELARDMCEAIDTPSYSIGEMLDSSRYRKRFIAAMENDLDTPAAIEQLRLLTSEILSAEDTDISQAKRDLRELAGILGLTLSD